MKEIYSEAAFPYVRKEYCAGVQVDIREQGMSKRFYAACMAMQGILSNNGKSNNPHIEDSGRYYRNIIEESYMAADELLKQEYGKKD